MPLTTINPNKNSSNNQNDISGLEYPEAFVMVIVTVMVSVSLHFHFTAVMLLMATLVGLLTTVYLSYRHSFNVVSDLSVMVVMAMVLGFTQFYEPIVMSVLLLSGIRLILADESMRITMAITMALTTAISYLLHILVSMPDIEMRHTYNCIILLLALLVAWWQFWEVYTHGIACEQAIDKSKTRLSTMVSIISKLTRFIPPQVWKPIVKDNLPVNVFNKRVKLSIMFSDIVGFTELSDTLSSDNLADILNTYMDSMTLIANRHGAVLDKFIGDGMVCFFGEPTSIGVRQDALSCVAMAIDMRREMRKLRHKWRLEGFEGLYVRIGIHTGYCHVGNYGSSNRLNYTMIGRSVNLTSRIESAAAKGTILISQDTYDYVSHDYTCVAKKNLQLKGFDKPVMTYEVLDPEERQGMATKWIDKDLPGFNLQLDFKDIKNYDYRAIKAHLNFALEQVEKAEGRTDK